MTKRTIEILTRGELDLLLASCKPHCASGLRDRALLALLYGCGLRISEALALRPVDVDLVAGTVRVHNGKGGKARTSGIETRMGTLVGEWVAYRASALRRKPTEALFCTTSRHGSGEAVQAACVRQMLARRTSRAGVNKRVHAHGFRHSHAANMAAAGIPLNVIQKQLGHSNISTTSLYLDHIQPTQVIAAIRGMG